MNLIRIALLAAVVVSSVALAQVKVQKGNATVKVGAGGGVEVTGADGQKVKIDTSTGTTTTTEADDDDADSNDAYVIDGQGRTETHACKADESIEVNGQGHVITLTGTCRSVSINGQGHTVAVEKVGVVEVNGMGNTVTWKSSIVGKKPKLVVNGLNNSVKQAR